MSHTIGQAKQDAQKSNSNSNQSPQDSLNPGASSSESVSRLSDADYEFLFNQLLEGIAHGWHDRRIVKFFQQLGDQGKQSDWVAWFDRLRDKRLKLPIESKRQLGTMMIRFGELTQSATEINQIGAASHRLGKELLFGNSVSVIWEYVGPDLSLDEPEDAFSETLVSADELWAEDLATPQPTVNVAESSRGINLDLEPDGSDQMTSDDEEFELERQSSADHVSTSSADLASPSEDNPRVAADRKPELPISADDELADALQAFELNSTPESSSIDDLATINPAIPAAQEEQKANLELKKESAEISPAPNYSEIEQQDQGSPPIIVTRELDDSSLAVIESWFNLGLKQVSGGEYSKAIASWDKALSINANLPEAWHNRGSALGRLGNYEAAVKSFQNALEIDPDNYQAWNDRAHALYQLQNWSEAVESWTEAIKIMPGNHLFWYNRGCALEQLAKWDSAIASYEKALEIKPDFQPGRSRYINLVADNSRPN